MATPIEKPQDLFLHQLRTMHWIEVKLAEEVLPELYEHVHATDLKWSIERHLGETEGHVKNLRRIFEIVQEPGDPEESPTLLGMKKEHDQMMKKLDGEQHAVVDLFHTDVIARTEHVEMAAYNGLVHLAKALEAPEDVIVMLLENKEQEEHALEQAEHAMAKLLAEKVENA